MFNFRRFRKMDESTLKTMTVYNGGSQGRATIFVTPGEDHPEVREWISEIKDERGEVIDRRPIMLTVRFEAGAAEVPENLGKYMIACQLASRKPVAIQPRAFVTADPALAPAPPKMKPMAVGRSIGEVAALQAAGKLGL
jgi:hypothetical protein